jgi:hypothetical protein
MTATRTPTAAFFALLTAGLFAGSADAQIRTPGQGVKAPATKVQLPKPTLAKNPALTNPALQVPAGVKDRLNAADLAVTSIQVQADNTVKVTVKNVGRSATPRAVKLFLGSSGAGNIDNLAESQTLDVPVMAAGESRVFVGSKFLVQNARAEVDGPGVILIAANVDKLEQIAEPSEANNILIISTK